MKAEFVDGNMMNSDLGVVNCARTSLSKYHSVFQEPDDSNLIKYLAKNNHISPFFHSRLYFCIEMNDKERLYFYENANLAGFHFAHIGNNYYIKGSLYGFIRHLNLFPSTVYPMLAINCIKQFPISWEALLVSMNNRRSWHGIPRGCMQVSEDDIINLAQENSELYKLCMATIRIKLPIFVARQVRTSQVGFFYSDMYVEGESFAFNEVSRRYVNEEPEFYEIKQWRVREGGKVKQGSTGLADDKGQSNWEYFQKKVHEKALELYTFSQEEHIAPEQARVLLSQDMYTEWFQTGSLHRWSQWLALRLDKHVQQETRECAEMVRDCLKQRFAHWSETYGF